MNPIDIFLPLALCNGPFFGQQIGFLHYGRPARPVRWGARSRGFAASIFTGTDNGSGSQAFGDPALIEGPGPMYGEEDDEPSVSLGGGGGGPIGI